MSKLNLTSPRDFFPRFFELFQPKNPLGYNGGALVQDLIAGLTVGIVALPLAMAFSIAAGGTPEQGLYTAIFAGFFTSLLGGSRYQIGGPTGAFVVIIYGIIARRGIDGLVIATIMAGFLLILMGVSGLGRLIKFIPYPVTTGFTTGIGVLIFSQQVKDFLGLNIDKSSPEFFERWVEYFKAFPTWSWQAAALGVGTILVIILVRRFAPRVPASVVAVAFATLACVLMRMPIETIASRFGGIPSSFRPPRLPVFDWATLRDVFPDALTIALLAGIESLLSAVVADGMTGDKHNSNMELVAQGLGNIASALFGGIPATGAIARTATNIKAGAVTPVAGIVHALALSLFILLLSPLASAVPLTALSAVLMVVAWDMSDLNRFTRLLKRAPKSDTIVLVVTFILTVVVDLTVAVEVGVILAVFLFLKRMVEVSGINADSDISVLVSDVHEPRADAHTNKLSDNNTLQEALSPTHPKSIEIFEINGPFFFGVADLLQETLLSLEKKPKAFILRMRSVPALDSTGIAALESFADRCRRNGTVLFLCEIREQPRRALERAGYLDELGRDRICATATEAVAEARRLIA